MREPLEARRLVLDAPGPSVGAEALAWVRAHAWALVAGLLVFAAGIALRWWVLQTSLGTADLDEATVAIHAQRFIEGDVSPFFLNQPYGGTVETGLVVPSFRLFGTGEVALKGVPIALALVAALLSYRIAVRIGLNTTAQWCVPVLVWCGPAYAVLFSTKERGFYGVALVLAAAYPLLVLRLADRPSLADAALLGVCVGLGWWQSPLTMLVAVPACLWLVIARPHTLRLAGWAFGAAVLAALPWIIWNTEHEWSSVRSGHGFGSSWWDRFFDWMLRMQVVFGVDTPFDVERTLLPSRWVGLVLLVIVVVVASARTAKTAPGLLAVLVLGYGVLYAANSLAAGVGADPRYTYLMVPTIAVCIASLIPEAGTAPRRSGIVLLVGASVTSTAWGLVGVRDAADRPDPNPFLASPGIDEVADVLVDRGITSAISDIAGMQITYLTDGAVVGSSFGAPRGLEERARSADPATYVLDDVLNGNADRLHEWLVANDVGFVEEQIGKWRVFYLDRNVTPEEANLRSFGGRLEPLEEYVWLE